MKLNQSGLGIVQVLVATAMLGVLTLGVMQISKNMSDVNRNANSSLDVLMLKQEMTSIVNNSNDCSVSLIDGIPFKKSDIDEPNTVEGRDVELGYSDYKDKTRRSKIRFKSGDKFGNIKINEIKLVMNNPTVPPGGDYALGNYSDSGIIQVVVEKAENRGIKFQIPVRVNFSTDPTNNSTISSCAGVSGSEEKLLVVHSQDADIPPPCPPNWTLEREGYSFIMATIGAARINAQDLADPGSCLEKFGATIQIECEINEDKCEYITPNDSTTWLLGKRLGPTSFPSRCSVCSKKNGVVKVLHSQSSIAPSCPPTTIPFYSGVSLMSVSINDEISASFRLDGTGSCIRDFKNGLPFIECKDKNKCPDNAHDDDDDFAMFLNAIPGNDNQGSKKPSASLNDISKCTVCLGVD